MAQKNRQLALDGIMTYSKTDDGRLIADFVHFEQGVEIAPVKGTFHGQLMRDGNFYLTQHKKRTSNKPLFRQDDSSLSLGIDHIYYFVFRLPEDQLAELPDKLVRQANEAAAKISGMFYKKMKRP